MKVKVRITAVLEVDLGEVDEDFSPYFQVEENGCPGTGAVGAALLAAIAEGERTSTCWACAHEGKNEIIDVDGERVLSPGGGA